MANIQVTGGNNLNEAGDLPRYRVLIVDDEEINLKIIRIYLEDKGYEVISALNGEEAIQLLKTEEITVCICDIRMPRVSGIDVLNFVQQNVPVVPVIMLTGFIDINTAVSVMRQGARNYLTKPIDANELIISVEKAIEHRKLVEAKLSLEAENLEYQRTLERRIEEKTIQIQRGMFDMVVSLANAVEERDPRLIGHSKRVAQYAAMLARHGGYDKDVQKTLHNAAILHDIGKIGLPDALLWRHDDMHPEELTQYQTHVPRGLNILEPSVFLQSVLPAVGTHHENFDGTGFPKGLKGDAIPLPGRILRLADHFDQLTAGRSNRPPMEAGAAADELLKGNGTLFDPDLTTLFLDLVRKMIAKLPKTP